MARLLFVVDLQPEFVKDRTGEKIYHKAIEYITVHRSSYKHVFAFVYKNDMSNSNMGRYVEYDECKNITPLEFEHDFEYDHCGYCPVEFPQVNAGDTIDIFGFDTDACVLATCFQLFDRDYKFNILSDLCWSSGGKKMHEAGLDIMYRQFRKALS